MIPKLERRFAGIRDRSSGAIDRPGRGSTFGLCRKRNIQRIHASASKGSTAVPVVQDRRGTLSLPMPWLLPARGFPDLARGGSPDRSGLFAYYGDSWVWATDRPMPTRIKVLRISAETRCFFLRSLSSLPPRDHLAFLSAFRESRGCQINSRDLACEIGARR